MRCAVVGGGIIGLSVAWRLASRGVEVQVYDAWAAASAARRESGGGSRSGSANTDSGLAGAGAERLNFAGVGSSGVGSGFEDAGPVAADAGVGSGSVVVGSGLAGAWPGSGSVGSSGAWPGAWFVAAGMLAAGNEGTWESAALGALMVESARRWPGFAGELGVAVPEGGTLVVALTADDVGAAEREWARQPGARLGPSGLRELEPGLSPLVRAGCHLPGDRQVDPRRVVAALERRVSVVPEKVVDLEGLDADQVVVAAGVGTAELTGLPVRPVKGELLRLRGDPGLLRHVVSGYADGRRVYLVPRPDGEVIVGATQEERTDHAVSAGAVLELLRAATELVPALADCAIAEVLAGHRPSTPDNAPLLGRLDARTVVASGHHRNGVLLAPITADLIADLVVTGKTDPLIAPFAPRRFA